MSDPRSVQAGRYYTNNYQNLTNRNEGNERSFVDIFDEADAADGSVDGHASSDNFSRIANEQSGMDSLMAAWNEMGGSDGDLSYSEISQNVSEYSSNTANKDFSASWDDSGNSYYVNGNFANSDEYKSYAADREASGGRPIALERCDAGVASVTIESLSGSTSAQLIADRSACMSDIQANRDAMNSETQAQQSVVDDAKTVYDDALGQMALYEEQNGVENEQLEALRTQKTECDSQISNQQGVVQELQSSADAQRSVISSIDSQLGALVTPEQYIMETNEEGEEIQKPNPEYDAYLQQKAALEEQKPQAEAQLSQIEQEVATAQDALSVLQEESASVDEQIAQQLEVVAQGEGEYAELAQQAQECLETYQQEQEALSSVSQGYEANIAQLQENLTAYDAAIAEAQVAEQRALEEAQTMNTPFRGDNRLHETLDENGNPVRSIEVEGFGSNGENGNDCLSRIINNNYDLAAMGIDLYSEEYHELEDAIKATNGLEGENYSLNAGQEIVLPDFQSQHMQEQQEARMQELQEQFAQVDPHSRAEDAIDMLHSQYDIKEDSPLCEALKDGAGDGIIAKVNDKWKVGNEFYDLEGNPVEDTPVPIPEVKPIEHRVDFSSPTTAPVADTPSTPEAGGTQGINPTASTAPVENDKPDYNSPEWSDVTSEANKFLFWETGTYTFKASDGSTIKVSNTDNVQVKENKETGEIVVIGANKADITAKKDSNITVVESTVNSISAKSGSTVNVTEKSTVGNIRGGWGSQTINISNGASVQSVKTGWGDDTVTVSNSDVAKVNTGWGSDSVTISDSTVSSDVKTSLGHDNVTINNSNVGGNLSTGFGNDNVDISGSSMQQKVSTGAGNDNVNVTNSTLKGNLNTESGNDTVVIDNTTVSGNIDVGSNDNSLTITNSSVSQDSEIHFGGGSNTFDVQSSQIAGNVRLQGAYDSFDMEAQNSLVRNVQYASNSSSTNIVSTDSAIGGLDYLQNVTRNVTSLDTSAGSIYEGFEKVEPRSVDSAQFVTLRSTTDGSTMVMSRAEYESGASIESTYVYAGECTQTNYVLQDGTTIWADGVGEVYYNEETGEIILNGLNNANISGNTTSTITSLNSNIQSQTIAGNVAYSNSIVAKATVEQGTQDTNVVASASYMGDFNVDNADATLTVMNGASVDTVSVKGEDNTVTVMLDEGGVKNIDAYGGANIVAQSSGEHSTYIDSMTSERGTIATNLVNTNVDEIVTRQGSLILTAQGGTIKTVENKGKTGETIVGFSDVELEKITSKSKADITLVDCTIRDITTKDGDDSVVLQDTTAKKVDTGKGSDAVYSKDSTVDKIVTADSQNAVVVEGGEVKTLKNTGDTTVYGASVDKMNVQGNTAIQASDINTLTMSSMGNNNLYVKDSIIGHTVDSAAGYNNTGTNNNNTYIDNFGDVRTNNNSLEAASNSTNTALETLNAIEERKTEEYYSLLEGLAPDRVSELLANNPDMTHAEIVNQLMNEEGGSLETVRQQMILEMQGAILDMQQELEDDTQSVGLIGGIGLLATQDYRRAQLENRQRILQTAVDSGDMSQIMNAYTLLTDSSASAQNMCDTMLSIQYASEVDAQTVEDVFHALDILGDRLDYSVTDEDGIIKTRLGDWNEILDIGTNRREAYAAVDTYRENVANLREKYEAGGLSPQELAAEYKRLTGFDFTQENVASLLDYSRSNDQFDNRAEDTIDGYHDTQQKAFQVAEYAAVMAAGMAVTLATGGAAGPAVAAALSSLGKVGIALTATTASFVTKTAIDLTERDSNFVAYDDVTKAEVLKSAVLMYSGCISGQIGSAAGEFVGAWASETFGNALVSTVLGKGADLLTDSAICMATSYAVSGDADFLYEFQQNAKQQFIGIFQQRFSSAILSNPKIQYANMEYALNKQMQSFLDTGVTEVEANTKFLMSQGIPESVARQHAGCSSFDLVQMMTVRNMETMYGRISATADSQQNGQDSGGNTRGGSQGQGGQESGYQGQTPRQLESADIDLNRRALIDAGYTESEAAEFAHLDNSMVDVLVAAKNNGPLALPEHTPAGTTRTAQTEGADVQPTRQAAPEAGPQGQSGIPQMRNPADVSSRQRMQLDPEAVLGGRTPEADGSNPRVADNQQLMVRPQGVEPQVQADSAGPVRITEDGIADFGGEVNRVPESDVQVRQLGGKEFRSWIDSEGRVNVETWENGECVGFEQRSFRAPAADTAGVSDFDTASVRTAQDGVADYGSPVNRMQQMADNALPEAELNRIGTDPNNPYRNYGDMMQDADGMWHRQIINSEGRHMGWVQVAQDDPTFGRIYSLSDETASTRAFEAGSGGSDFTDGTAGGGGVSVRYAPEGGGYSPEDAPAFMLDGATVDSVIMIDPRVYLLGAAGGNNAGGQTTYRTVGENQELMVVPQPQRQSGIPQMQDPANAMPRMQFDPNAVRMGVEADPAGGQTTYRTVAENQELMIRPLQLTDGSSEAQTGAPRQQMPQMQDPANAMPRMQLDFDAAQFALRQGAGEPQNARVEAGEPQNARVETGEPQGVRVEAGELQSVRVETEPAKPQFDLENLSPLGRTGVLNMVEAAPKTPDVTDAQKAIMEAVAQGKDLGKLDLQRYINNEYDVVRERNQYARDYGDETFVSSKEELELALNGRDDSVFQMSKEGVLVLETEHWAQHGSVSEPQERLSVNVKASAEMISEIDLMFKAARQTGKYTLSDGTEVEVGSFAFKAPANMEGWNNRQDTLTFYFEKPVTQGEIDAIADITAKYARGTVTNANEAYPWISNSTKYPTNEMVTELANQIREYNPSLASSLSWKVSKYGNNANISEGEFDAYSNMLRYMQEATANAPRQQDAQPIRQQDVQPQRQQTPEVQPVRQNAPAASNDAVYMAREFIGEGGQLIKGEQFIVEDNAKLSLQSSDSKGIVLDLSEPSVARQIAQLGEGESLTVGRNPDSDICINDPTVSGKHLTITRQGNDLVVVDRSMNGTFYGDNTNGQGRIISVENEVQPQRQQAPEAQPQRQQTPEAQPQRRVNAMDEPQAQPQRRGGVDNGQMQPQRQNGAQSGEAPRRNIFQRGLDRLKGMFGGNETSESASSGGRNRQENYQESPAQTNRSPEYQQAADQKLEQLRQNSKSSYMDLNIDGQRVRVEAFQDSQQGSNSGMWVRDVRTGELSYVKQPSANTDTQRLANDYYQQFRSSNLCRGMTNQQEYEAAYAEAQRYTTAEAAQKAYSEVLASNLYRLTGQRTPELEVVRNSDGSVGVASRFENLDLPSGSSGDAAAIRQGFAADAWLANWDALKTDTSNPSRNNIWMQDGEAIRGDVGGALTYRARGTSKGAAFGENVGELTSFFGRNSLSRQYLMDMTPQELDASLSTVTRLSDEQIRNTVYEQAGQRVAKSEVGASPVNGFSRSAMGYVYQDGISNPEYLTQTLIARRDYMADFQTNMRNNPIRQGESIDNYVQRIDSMTPKRSYSVDFYSDGMTPSERALGGPLLSTNQAYEHRLGEYLTPEQKQLLSDSYDAVQRQQSGAQMGYSSASRMDSGNRLTQDNMLHSTSGRYLESILQNGLMSREFTGVSSARRADGSNPGSMTPMCADVYDVDLRFSDNTGRVRSYQNCSIEDYFFNSNRQWAGGENAFLPSERNGYLSGNNQIVIVFNRNGVDQTVMDNSFRVADMNSNGARIMHQDGNMSGYNNYTTHRAVPVGLSSGSIEKIIVADGTSQSTINQYKQIIANSGLNINLYSIHGQRL